MGHPVSKSNQLCLAYVSITKSVGSNQLSIAQFLHSPANLPALKLAQSLCLCLVLEMFTFHKILDVKLLFYKKGGHFNKETTPQSKFILCTLSALASQQSPV